MPIGMIGEMAVTAALAVTCVTLWTVRIAVTARGSRLLGAILAATEAMVFITIFSQIVDGFDSPHRILAYGVGVAIGTTLGLTVDRRINPQLSRVDVVDPSGLVATAVESAGWSHTQTTGVGATGHVSMVSMVTSERNVPEVLAVVADVAPSSLWTVTPVRRANTGRDLGSIRPASPRSISVGRLSAVRTALRPIAAVDDDPVVVLRRSTHAAVAVAERAAG
jgi:uncharacterized protein YebE (UPF0316 family)